MGQYKWKRTFRGNWPRPFLPSSVPDLQFDLLPGHLEQILNIVIVCCCWEVLPQWFSCQTRPQSCVDNQPWLNLILVNKTRHSLMDSELFLKFMVKMFKWKPLSLVTSPLSAFELMWIREDLPVFFTVRPLIRLKRVILVKVTFLLCELVQQATLANALKWKECI